MNERTPSNINQRLPLTDTSEMTSFVTYYRVSTASQGRSGLGLAAQRTRVQEFLSYGDEVVAEFVEIESGKKDDRVELWKAVAFAKRTNARILIAKLDRFSRRVSFISGLMDQGVGLVVADMPNASDFQLHIFAALAQEERRLISDRTRAALHEAKRRGVRLGKNATTLAFLHREQARERALGMAPVVKPLMERGASYCEIARILNERGLTTGTGRPFFPQSVKNIVVRLQEGMNECPTSELAVSR